MSLLNIQQPNSQTACNLRVTSRQLSILLRQLSSLLRSGMSLVPAIAAIQQQMSYDARAYKTGADVVQLLQDIGQRVNAGCSLSDAMASHSGVFDRSMIAAVAAAEVSGSLDLVLADLAEQAYQRDRLRMQVISCIIYPAFMLIMAIGVVTFMLVYVLPSLGQVFEQMHMALPWPTRIVMGIGFAARKWGLFGVSLACAVAIAYWSAIRSEQTNQRMDRLLLSVPWLGQMIIKAELARLSSTLASLLTAGVSLPRAMAIAGQVLSNYAIRTRWIAITEAVCEGHTLAGAVRDVGLFPPIFFHALSTAEDTGGFAECLTELAQMYRSDIQIASKVAVAVLEPFILLVMGIVMGLIVMAVLLPIFSINRGIS